MQDESKDCGAACLLILIKTYGGNVSMEYLRTLTNTSKNGTNFYYLSVAAKTIGFDYRALKGDVLKLNKKNLPCIAHVIVDSKYKHFVVINSIGRKYIEISDPARGLLKMTIDEFRNISTNQYLVLVPNKKIPVIKNNNDIINFIVNIVKDSKQIILTIFFFSLVYTIINILISYGFQFIIEDSINISDINNLYFIITFLIIFAIIKNILDFFRNRLLNYINCKVDIMLIKNTFNHIISLPYQYYKAKSTSDITSRINDLGDIRNTFSNFMMYLFVDSILAVFVFFSLININSSLTFIIVIIVILYLVVIKIFNPFLSRNVLEIQEQSSKVNMTLVESLESVESIKGQNLENTFCNKFNDDYNVFSNKTYKFLNIFNIENLIKNLIDDIGVILIMFFGALLVLKNKMTVGELITYNTLIIYFLEPIKNIINSDVSIKKFKTSLRRINDLYSIHEEKYKLDNKYTNDKIIGNIDISNLNYSFNGRNKVLTDIDMKISKGERILLCGESGSGKSTLVKMLVKYYEIDNNIIRIDNKDINDYNLLEIRRDVCYVSQKEKLLTDSIYNNIVLDRDISYDMFLKLCNIFQIDNIVKNNICKYDMFLEEDGFNISGGERQKIIMARALIRDCSIYIFDESLSQVDVINERIILKELFEYLKDKTIIFISHRFENKDLFDKVFNLNEGRIYD